VAVSKTGREEAARIYDEKYNQNRRAVPGSEELLLSFAGRMKIGLVTNGMVEAQMNKLRICGLDGLFNCIIISEAVGHRKPDAKIFEAALNALIVSPGDAVFVGDSWENDIVPATVLGMRAVWLNRYGAACPDSSISMEIHSLSDEKLARILE
jgi:putative hydrolase of the HAD superfamily